MVKNLHKLFALVLLCCAYLGSNNAWGQVTLTTSPYTQNFDGVAGGLPTGWSVRTGANATTLGNTATFVTNLTAWSSTSGQFNNRASLDGLTTTATSAEQSASTDRVVAVRQTGSVGDPGAAFVFTLANTLGFRDFSIDFKAQELTNDGRTIVWTVDYGIGENPTEFVSTGTTITTSGIQSTDVTVPVSSLTALNNQSEPVHIRIVALSSSTGSGSRDVFAIDDFTLNFESANSTTPSLIAPTTLNLGDGVMGSTLTGSYTLSGRNLGGDVTVTATSPVEISKTAGTGFATTLTFTAQELENEQTIYIRATSATAGELTASITHTSAGATDAVLNVSGSFASPYAQDFSNCGTTLPGGWTSQNVTGDQVWVCTTFGRTNNAVQINGFSGGSKNNEDWLISPKLDLSGFSIPLVSFYTRSAFVGPALKVMVSTNYDGTSAPSTATWTELNVALPEAGSDAWTMSEALLDAYKQASVYVAFVYTSVEETNGSSRWTLDDFKVENVAKYLSSVDRSYDFGMVKAWTPEAPLTFQTFKALGFTEPLVISSTSIDPTTQSHLDFEFSKTNTPGSYSNTLTYTVEELNDGEDEKLYIRFLPKSTYLIFQSAIKATSGSEFTQNLGTLIGSSILKNTTLDVVTWNVEWFGAARDGDGAILGPTDDALQYQNVKKAIEIMDADIYALQEIANDELMAQLIGELPDYGFVKSDVFSYSERPANFESTPQKLYFVYKKANVTVKSEKVLLKSLYSELLANTKEIANYPGGNDDAFWASGRLPYMVEFEVNIEGVTQRLHLLNIHARANSGTNTTVVAQRRKDLEILKDSLDAQYANVNLIMLGDYNDDVDASVVNSTLTSTYDIFVNDADYKVLTYDLSQATTQGTYNRSSFLDHITVSSRLTKSYINQSIRIEEGLYTAIPRYHDTTSDHGPVSARFFLSATPVVTFSEATLTKTEGDAAFNVNLTLNEAQSVEQTVTISIADNATAGAGDYTLTGAENGNVTVTIPANATTASFEVNITDDTIIEATEEVTFVISNTSNLIGIGSGRSLKLAIQDNDKATISFAATAVEVAEGSGELTVTLNLDQASLTEETVQVAVQSSTATSTDYTTTPAASNNLISLTIPAGSTTATFVVNVLEDAVIEANEVVTFNLTNPSTGLVLGANTGFNLTITDNDKATVSFDITAQTVAENAGSASVTLNLSSASTKQEQIVVNVANATGVIYGAQGDYTTSPAVTNNTITVTVPAGATTASFTVTIVDDTEIENPETITFSLGTLSSGLATGQNTTYALTISGNDSPNGIADATKGQFSVYPNPAVGTVGVKLALPERVAVQSKVSVTVYALDGKKALNISGTLEEVQKQINVKTADLRNGMYIILVEAGKEYFQTKLIKQ